MAVIITFISESRKDTIRLLIYKALMNPHIDLKDVVSLRSSKHQQSSIENRMY
jgi:hypothetical protein